MPGNVDIKAAAFDFRLLALAAASFAMGTEAYVYVGHLEPLSRELGIGIAEAGLLAAAFALTYAVTAPVIASLTARTDRRTLVVAGLAAISLLNLAASMAPGFGTLLALRVGCGLAAATAGPAASAAAAALAPAERRGRAMAVVLGGMTLAFILGIPLGSVVGEFGGWRATFVVAGVIAALAAVAAQLSLPNVPGLDAPGLGRLTIAFRHDIFRTLALTTIGFAATFTVIAYIGPVAAAVAGLRGAGVGALQALIGIGSILGIVVGARYADRSNALLVVIWSFGVSAVALSVYAVLPALRVQGSLAIALLSLAMIAGAAALFARTPVIQARLVRLAPESTSVLLALNGSMVFVGQGLGAAIGALTIAVIDVGAVGFVAAVIALFGLAMAAFQASNFAWVPETKRSVS